MLDRDFSYDWEEIRGGGVIMSRRLTSSGAVVEERYLSGDDATQFRREYNAAVNKEKSRIFKKQCVQGSMHPGELTHNAIAAYF